MNYYIDLPFPPSVNTYWRHARGRHYISPKGVAFREAVIERVRQIGKPPMIAGPVAVRIGLRMPDRRKRDIDNFGGKAVLDALVSAGVLVDDSQVKDLHIVYEGVLKPGCCDVEIKEMTSGPNERLEMGRWNPKT